jgi:hypothetical protein
MVNRFNDDAAYICTQWLLRQISSRGLTVKSLVKVQRGATTHILALLSGGSYVCDCMMGTNAGIPCRHYFAVLNRSPNVRFSLALVQKRYVHDQMKDR